MIRAGWIVALALAAFPFTAGATRVPAGDCARVQEAIDALPSTGGTVELEIGKYICDRPIVIRRDHIALVGQGSALTRISVRPGLTMPLLVVGEPETVGMYPIRETRDVMVSGLALDGQRHSHVNPSGNECYDFKNYMSLDCSHGDGHLVRNNGLTIRRARDVRAYDVESFGHVSGGLVTEKLSFNLEIDGFKAHDNYYDGFAGYETTDSVLRNFDIRDNAYSGISIDLSFEGNIIEDGVVADNLDNGIFSAQVGRNLFRRLQVTGNRTYGFYFDGSRSKDKDGNSVLVPDTCNDIVIQDSGIAGGRAGVYVNHLCRGMKLERLRIAHPELNCVSRFPGSDVIETEVSCERL